MCQAFHIFDSSKHAFDGTDSDVSEMKLMDKSVQVKEAIKHEISLQDPMVRCFKLAN